MGGRMNLLHPKVLAQRKAWQIVLEYQRQHWKNVFWIDYNIPFEGRVFVPYGAIATIRDRDGKTIAQGPVLAFFMGDKEWGEIDVLRIGNYEPDPNLPLKDEFIEVPVDVAWEDGMRLHLSWLQDGISHSYHFIKEGDHVHLYEFSLRVADIDLRPGFLTEFTAAIRDLHRRGPHGIGTGRIVVLLVKVKAKPQPNSETRAPTLPTEDLIKLDRRIFQVQSRLREKYGEDWGGYIHVFIFVPITDPLVERVQQFLQERMDATDIQILGGNGGESHEGS